MMKWLKFNTKLDSFVHVRYKYYVLYLTVIDSAHRSSYCGLSFADDVLYITSIVEGESENPKDDRQLMIGINVQNFELVFHNFVPPTIISFSVPNPADQIPSFYYRECSHDFCDNGLCLVSAT